MDDSEYLPSEEDLQVSPSRRAKDRERSVTPFLLRSQGRSEGESLIFCSRISPSPSRSLRRKRQRRQPFILDTTLSGSDTEDAASPPRGHKSPPLLLPTQRPFRDIQATDNNSHPSDRTGSGGGGGGGGGLSRRSLFTGDEPVGTSSGAEENSRETVIADSRMLEEERRVSRAWSRTVRRSETEGSEHHHHHHRQQHWEQRLELRAEKMVTSTTTTTTAIGTGTRRTGGDRETTGLLKTPEQRGRDFDWSRALEQSPRLRFWDGGDWRQSPRTGYTYVNSLTYRDTVTPGREIQMPHMARWPIYHRGETTTVESTQSSWRQERRRLNVVGTRLTSQSRDSAAEFSDDDDDALREDAGDAIPTWLPVGGSGLDTTGARRVSWRTTSGGAEGEQSATRWLTDSSSRVGSTVKSWASSQILSSTRWLISLLVILILLPFTSGHRLLQQLLGPATLATGTADLMRETTISRQSSASSVWSFLHTLKSLLARRATLETVGAMQETEQREDRISSSSFLSRLALIYTTVISWLQDGWKAIIAETFISWDDQQLRSRPTINNERREEECSGDLLTDDDENDFDAVRHGMTTGSRWWRRKVDDDDEDEDSGLGLLLLPERLPELLLVGIPANYSAGDDMPRRPGLQELEGDCDWQRVAENVANESLELSAAAGENAAKWRARLSALLVALTVFFYPIYLAAEFVTNTRDEIFHWLYPRPEPRRSRRLRGLPPDTVEEMKRQRRLRRAAPQHQAAAATAAAGGLSATTGTATRGFNDSDSEEDYIHERAQQWQQTELKKRGPSLFSLLLLLKGLFYRSKKELGGQSEQQHASGSAESHSQSSSATWQQSEEDSSGNELEKDQEQKLIFSVWWSQLVRFFTGHPQDKEMAIAVRKQQKSSVGPSSVGAQHYQAGGVLPEAVRSASIWTTAASSVESSAAEKESAATGTWTSLDDYSSVETSGRFGVGRIYTTWWRRLRKNVSVEETSAQVSYNTAASEGMQGEEGVPTKHRKTPTRCLLLLLLPLLLLLLAVLACAMSPSVCPGPLHRASAAVVTAAGQKAASSAALISTGLSQGMTALQDAASTTAGWLAKAAAGLTDWPAWLLNGLWQNFRLGLESVVNWMSQSFSLLSRAGLGVSNLTVSLVVPGWNGLARRTTEAWSSSASWAGKGWHSLTDLGTAVGDFLVRLPAITWNGAASLVSGAWHHGASWTAQAWQYVTAAGSAAWGWTFEMWQSMTGSLGQAVRQIPSSCFSLLQSAGYLISSPLASVRNFIGDLLLRARDMLQIVVVRLGELLVYLVNQSLAGLGRIVNQLGQAGQSLYTVSRGFVQGADLLLTKAMRSTWQGMQEWLVSPLFTGASAVAELASSVLRQLWGRLSAGWSWLGSRAAGVSVPQPRCLLSWLASGRNHLLHLLSAAWDKTAALVYRPRAKPLDSSTTTATDIDIGALVDKILESRKFQESLAVMVQARNPEGGKPSSELARLESDLGAKLDARLEEARADLTSLVENLTRDLAREIKVPVEGQTENEKRLADLLIRLREQQELLKEKSDLWDSMQTKSARAAEKGSDQTRLDIMRLTDHITVLETEVAELMGGLPSCCKSMADIEAAVRVVLGDLLAGRGADCGLSDQLAAWLGRLFVSRSEMEEAAAGGIKAGVSESQEQLVAHITDLIRAELAQNAAKGPASAGETATMTQEEVVRIVQAALVRYDADKTGQFDYALETAGGSVISTRCTETYVQKTALYSIFGIPVWYPSNNPRTIIQPGVQPGQCWAFKGSAGFVVIQLSEPVQPTSFSMEHIAQSMSPSGRIDSAPRDFVVLGLRSEKDPEPFRLGSYTYSQEGGRLPLQFFAVQFPNEEYFPYIELDINSNHGNVNYTCLYRFRVHGTPRPSG